LQVAVLQVKQREPRVLLQKFLDHEQLLAAQVVVFQDQFFEARVVVEAGQQIGHSGRGDLR